MSSSDLQTRIREARLAAGLSQTQLAEALCVTRNTVAGWEAGRFRPRADRLAAIAQITGVDLLQ